MAYVCMHDRVIVNDTQRSHNKPVQEIYKRYSGPSILPDNPGDSRFWSVSPGLQIRV